MTPRSPSAPLTPEQRLLAAIVFTDAASFSARMQVAETETLRLLERDFAHMREQSETLGGTVLKTTGDGLLLYFTSAVQAVEWALRVQRHFAALVRSARPNEALRHRVGVHVGDVFFTGGDVMGDGVNVAARVQGEAPPGGICISQTVYEVVKNKLPLEVVRLEPRKLKNIREHIQMYHVLLEPRPVPAAGPVTTMATAASASRPEREAAPPTSRRLGVVLLAIALALAAGLIFRAYRRHERELARSEAVQAELQAALRSRSEAEAATAGSTTAGDQPAPAEIEPFEFARLARDGVVSAEKTAEARASLPVLREWLMSELQRYTADSPLLVPGIGNRPDRKLYFDRGRLTFALGGIRQAVKWEELEPDAQGAVMVAAATHANPAPSREVIRAVGAFAYVNGLDWMGRRILVEARQRFR